jgi:hypothetical protein
VPIEISSLNLTTSGAPGDSVPLPALGTSAAVDVFVDFFNPGSEPFEAWPWWSFRVGGGGGSGNDGTWPIELTAISPTDPGGAVTSGVPLMILRESPTLASTGQHTLTTLPDGSFQIDSFFDVFTEISLDGGGTFYPADAPLRMTLTGVTPEPTTVSLALVAAAGCALVRRRR